MVAWLPIFTLQCLHRNHKASCYGVGVTKNAVFFFWRASPLTAYSAYYIPCDEISAISVHFCCWRWKMAENYSSVSLSNLWDVMAAMDWPLLQNRTILCSIPITTFLKTQSANKLHSTLCACHIKLVLHHSNPWSCKIFTKSMLK